MEENRRLRRRIAELEKEREILKRAVAFMRSP
jgi:transposase-like protein